VVEVRAVKDASKREGTAGTVRGGNMIYAGIIWLFTVSMVFGVRAPALASYGDADLIDLTGHGAGYFAIAVFVVAYLVVMVEEFTHLRKSKPVLLSAGIIWVTIAFIYAREGIPHAAEEAFRHTFVEFAELFMFLLVAMTYINAMEERNVFESLRNRLVQAGFSFRKLFWVTGLLSFFISPLADNLTTALVMCAVVMAMGKTSAKFVSLACVNIVVAANAGGAFSPFGDITTLMVWQKGIVKFQTFFHLFLPSVVNWLVPASIMVFFVPKAYPGACETNGKMKRGGKHVVALFGCTIATTVLLHNFLHLPPVAGMMMGLAYLKFYGFYLKKTFNAYSTKLLSENGGPDDDANDHMMDMRKPFDVFRKIARAEWDTLMFFYGVLLSVGGLGFMGYLALLSEATYTGWGATSANVAVGILSAIVDNIPVMFAVLTMEPDMSMGQWLLVTLTAGVGGSLLSIGSAAGVALMGQARGKYTFFSHLKWTPVIALGYAASIVVHLLVNRRLFN
jgi:NhaD family Na+/H+ antiporter